MFLFLGEKFFSIARHQALLLQLACIWFCILRAWWLFVCLTSPHLLDIKCTAFPPAHSAGAALMVLTHQQQAGNCLGCYPRAVCAPHDEWSALSCLSCVMQIYSVVPAHVVRELFQVLVGKTECLVSWIIPYILTLHCVLTARKEQLTFW